MLGFELTLKRDNLLQKMNVPYINYNWAIYVSHLIQFSFLFHSILKGVLCPLGFPHRVNVLNHWRVRLQKYKNLTFLTEDVVRVHTKLALASLVKGHSLFGRRLRRRMTFQNTIVTIGFIACIKTSFPLIDAKLPQIIVSLTKIKMSRVSVPYAV